LVLFSKGQTIRVEYVSFQFIYPKLDA